MRIKLLTSRSSVEGSNCYGDIIDVSKKEGEVLIASGQAESSDALKTFNSSDKETRIADLEIELRKEKEKNAKLRNETDAQRSARLKKGERKQ